jgi:hypothetical protein
MGFAKARARRRASCSARRLAGGRAFRRQAGGDVFRPLDFLLVAGAFKDAVRLFFARGFGAGLLGGAVGLGWFWLKPPLGRKRMPPRRRREKFLSLIINKYLR